MRMGFRAVVLTSVTWIWCFVSQRCGEDGVSGCCADLCDMDLGLVSQGCGGDGVPDCCTDLCDMDLVFCVTGVW